MRRLPALLALLLLVVVLPAPGASAQPVAPVGADAAARRAVAALPAATAVNDADGDKLFDGLERALRAAPGERVRTLVVFRAGVDAHDGAARVARVAPDAPQLDVVELVPVLVAEMTAEEAQDAARLGVVRQVEHDVPGTPELDEATVVMGVDVAVDDLGVTGDLDGDPSTATARDVNIAVLDSGIHAAHEQLDDGKVTEWIDLGGGSTEPFDANGHGTHVANIAAGWGDEDPAHRGVAPGAGIVGVRIEGGAGSASNALSGFEVLVERREELGVRVATISYGFGTATDGTTALEMAVDAAWDAGIVVFKSTGNGGPGNGTITVPAAARGILAIGSLIDPFGTATPGFGLSRFSSRGPTTDGRVKPDLAAPGDTIRAAQTGTRSGYVDKSGTSMASPFAAGAAALVIAADPTLQPDEVREVLIGTAEDFGAPGPESDFGHGRIRVAEAVAAALAGADGAVDVTPPAVPRHEGRVLTADVTGIARTTVEVVDAAFPLAVTALGEDGARIVAVDVAAGAQSLPTTGAAVVSGAPRQGGDTVRVPTPGLYTVTVLTQPLAEVAVAISHSTAEG